MPDYLCVMCENKDHIFYVCAVSYGPIKVLKDRQNRPPLLGQLKLLKRIRYLIKIRQNITGSERNIKGKKEHQRKNYYRLPVM